MITKAEAEQLRNLDATVRKIEREIAPAVLDIKTAKKQIAAIVDKAHAAMIADEVETRRRYGVVFRRVRKAGRVAWRSVVEKLKGKAYADAEAAKAAPVESCTFELSSTD